MWNTRDYQVELVLIRHGQVPGNLEKRYIGTTDQSLTEEGKAEFAKRDYPKADMLFVSPMKRCIESAAIIYPDLEANIIDEFREMNFGKFEGKNYEELNGDEEYQRWIDSGGMDRFPDGDRVDMFMLRVTRGISRMLHSVIEKIGDSDNNRIRVAAVVHGGTIMAIQAYLGVCSFYDKMYENGEFRVLDIEVKYDLSHDCITMRLYN